MLRMCYALRYTMIGGHLGKQPGHSCAGIAFPLLALSIAAKTPTAPQGMALARFLAMPDTIPSSVRIERTSAGTGRPWVLGKPATKRPVGVWQLAICYACVVSYVTLWLADVWVDNQATHAPASLPLPASRESQAALSAPPFRDVLHDTCQHQANYAICGGSVFYR
jgi:hypothetical protein